MNLFRAIKRSPFYVEVWLRLALARFLVKFIAFRRWRHVLGPIDGEQDPSDYPQLTEDQLKQASDIGRVVNRVAAHAILFKAICLPRAMAARWALAWRGIPSRIVIGSRRGGDTDPHDLMFHAWLMVADRVVTGASERDSYLALGRQANVAEHG